MKTINDVLGKANCTGCSACVSICPAKAISMIPNNEGFYYPTINNKKCVSCSKCLHFCPEYNPTKRNRIASDSAYMALLKEKTRQKKSASGGAFAGVAEYIIEKKHGTVFGAAYDNDLVVRHIAINRVDDLIRLQNSKYVQSNIGTSYIDAKRLLEEGQYVFFTGTLCQIAGLYSVLKEKYYDNLLTADIVCHGVPSPAFFARLIDENSRTSQGKVQDIKFRYKNSLFKSGSSFYLIMKMERGPSIVRRPKDDPYFNTFLKGYTFRESCYRCQYANAKRVGDFTFGDCDSHDEQIAFHQKESVSTLLLNSKNAQNIWDLEINQKFDTEQLLLEAEIIRNKQLKNPFHRPDIRDTIYIDLLNDTWNLVTKKYGNEICKYRRMRTTIGCVAPPFVTFAWRKIHG